MTDTDGPQTRSAAPHGANPPAADAGCGARLDGEHPARPGPSQRLARPPVPETAVQEAIVQAAHLCGWLVFHPFDSRRSEPGFPDLFLLHPATGRRLALELKSATGRVSAAQLAWLDAMRACGIPAAVIRPDDLDATLERLR